MIMKEIDFKTSSDNMATGHMIQLDGLRALAVLSVMYWHWLSNDQTAFPFGGGVQLFFVLSGFLITGILLRSRVDADAGVSRGSILKAFYARRFLRKRHAKPPYA